MAKKHLRTLPHGHTVKDVIAHLPSGSYYDIRGEDFSDGFYPKTDDKTFFLREGKIIKVCKLPLVVYGDKPVLSVTKVTGPRFAEDMYEIKILDN